MSMDASSIDMPRPDRVRTPAEFIAAMRALRSRAKLTYSQLESRAQAAGDRLPRSTIATALSRNRIPRESTIASFVRACGGDRHAVEVWLAARRRIAATDEAVEDLAYAVEAWLKGRARVEKVNGKKADKALDRALDKAMTNGHLDEAASEPDSAVAARVYAEGRLAKAVAQSKGDRWVGVHRKVEPDRPKRWRGLVGKLRPRQAGSLTELKDAPAGW